MRNIIKLLEKLLIFKILLFEKLIIFLEFLYLKYKLFMSSEAIYKDINIPW